MTDEAAENPEETAESVPVSDCKHDGERLVVLEFRTKIIANDIGAIKRAVLGFNGNPGMIGLLDRHEQRWINHDTWAVRKWGLFAAMFLVMFSAAVWIGRVKIMAIVGL